MSSVIQFLLYIYSFVSFFVSCLTYFTFGFPSCVCVCVYACVCISVFSLPSLALMYIKITPPLKYLYLYIHFVTLGIFLYFFLSVEFGSRPLQIFALLLSWFSFASVWGSSFSCQALSELTKRTLSNFKLGVLTTKRGPASICPFLRGQFSSIWVWNDINGEQGWREQ